jgi:hypothetical protein
MGEPSIIDNPRIDQLIRDGRLDEAMYEPLRTTSEPTVRLRGLLSSVGLQEDTAYGSLTLGDLLYDVIHVDPIVLQAAEFSHSHSIDGLFSFAVWAATFPASDVPSTQGAINGLEGFAAERLIGMHLEGQGHDVHFPDVSNEPGYDALVDGHPFQFKCLADVQGIHEHFARYTYPVIVNSELASDVAGMPGVYVDDLLHRSQVREIAESSMQHGTGMAEGHVPLLSILASSPVPLYRLYRRETDLVGAVSAIVTNTSARYVGGTIGGKSAAILGGALFGPAGSVLGLSLGSIAGAAVGRNAARIARGVLTKGDAQAVRGAAIETATLALESIPLKREAWEAKRAAVVDATKFGKATVIGSYIVARHDDDFVYMNDRARELARFRSELQSVDPSDVWKHLLVLIKRAGIHANVIQEPLSRLNVLTAGLAASKSRWMA